MLIRNATVDGAAGIDVRLSGGRIAECGSGLRPLPSEDDLDAKGGWALPGLHDHHIHLRALAAATESIQLDPPTVADADAFAERLRRADLESAAGVWIRGVGYHETVAGDLDRWVLDRIVPDRPVRIQHRSGALWVLNSRACEVTGLQDCPLPGVERDATGLVTGRLWRMDSWLGAQIGTSPPNLAAVSIRAAALGITGFTDATPALRQSDIDSLAEEVACGRIKQRLHCMAPPGIATPEVPRFTLGPNKILLDDDTLPHLNDFIDQVRTIHAAGRPVAVHCVTRVQLVLTMAALETAGVLSGDRIEHGAIIPEDSLPWLRQHRVPVVTQPHFIVERAQQYARDVPTEDWPDLWRLGSLLDAGLGVAAGTDAPFGGPDPWQVIRAALDRKPNLQVAEQLSLSAAVALFTGHAVRPAEARTIQPGQRGDLTLLSVAPADVEATPNAELIAATIVDGRPIYCAQ